jgi:hypothetical protein
MARQQNMARRRFGHGSSRQIKRAMGNSARSMAVISKSGIGIATWACSGRHRREQRRRARTRAEHISMALLANFMARAIAISHTLSMTGAFARCAAAACCCRRAHAATAALSKQRFLAAAPAASALRSS